MPPPNGGCKRQSVDIATSQPHAANLSHPSCDVNESPGGRHRGHQCADIVGLFCASDARGSAPVSASTDQGGYHLDRFLLAYCGHPRVQNIPIYVLDANESTVREVLNALHRKFPDDFVRNHTKPIVRIVRVRPQIGRGTNRIIVMPIKFRYGTNVDELHTRRQVTAHRRDDPAACAAGRPSSPRESSGN